MRPLAMFHALGRAVLTAAAVLIGASSAPAQDRLFAGTGEIGAFGRFGERLGTAPAVVHGLHADGGRYLVTGATAIHTQTGQAVAIPGGVIAVDPRRPRVFYRSGTTIAAFDLSSRTSTVLVDAPPPETFGLSVKAAQLAADADRLFVLRRGAGTSREVVVVDPATGVVTASYLIASPGPFELLADWLVSADGRRLTMATYSFLQVFDGATGELLIGRRFFVDSVRGIKLVDDRLHRRVYLVSQRQLIAYDDALEPLAALPLRSTCAVSSAAYSHHTGRLYTMESEGGAYFYGQPIPIAYFLSAFDAASGRRLDTREITRAAGVPSGSNLCSELPLSLVTAPGAPQAVSATVEGRDVTLTWTNVGDATGFVLDVGLAPGRTDVTFSIGAASPVTIVGAPPGTYHLRLRGTNVFGVSRPSNEVAITVP